MLTQFRLQDKTRLTDGEFRTVDLSSGQRKRLALIVSLLEKRPILLLDEWAADQDPEFRRKFYFELLPALHRAGVTVVAISHDDRYIEEMDVPIRRLRMDEGRFTELEFGGDRLMAPHPESLDGRPPPKGLPVVAFHRAQPADHRHLSDGRDACGLPDRPERDRDRADRSRRSFVEALPRRHAARSSPAEGRGHARPAAVGQTVPL